MDDKIVEFSNYILIEKNYSDYTDTNYLIDLNAFSSYLDNKKINYKTLTYKDIIEYVKFLKEEKHFHPTSINRHLSSLRSFYNFLLRDNTVKSNPFKLINSQKCEKKLPNYMDYEEIVTMINSCDDDILGLRNRCILELLFATGCRVSELVNIKVNDIDMAKREIKVLGKGNKERLVYFTDPALKALNNYLNNSRTILLNGKSSEYLFINHVGTNLTTRGVRVIIDQIITKSCINSKITPHTFRHTFATMLLNEGCDLKSVQELLGHVNLSTTSIYTHITNDRIKDVYLHSHPRSKQ